MQVLLLGGHGKIAQFLTPLLLSRSWNVTSVIRNPDHEREIRALGHGKAGKLDVLLSSLDDVKTEADARGVLDRVSPDCVVWAAGAGGKGGPERTKAIDEVAARHFATASFAHPRVVKFLLISHIGSRRGQPAWMSGEDWARLQHINNVVLPAYAKAKLEADEYLTALARKTNEQRKKDNLPLMQVILLRPGLLADDPATGKVAMGKIGSQGNIPREDVAIVADRLLARDDTHGWIDVLGGEVPVDEAVDAVVRDKVDAIEGEDVDAMAKRFDL